MSSTLLYLAIVAVWACVLVPMWLRRDTSRLLHRRSGAGNGYLADDTLDGPYEPVDEEPAYPAHRGVRRATVIARRRRRTFLLALALLAAGGTAATGLGPWWVALPPTGLMLGHLALLRVAAGIDATRRQERLHAQVRAEERVAEEVRLAEEAAKAEIIDLAERARARDVFDQYAEDVARAVGD